MVRFKTETAASRIKAESYVGVRSVLSGGSCQNSHIVATNLAAAAALDATDAHVEPGFRVLKTPPYDCRHRM